MKIISGKFKGRVVEMPRGIRPTSDKVREALFERLKGYIEGSSFLDLYCGSGAVGIEAFSRGVNTVSFVDNNFNCISVLRANLYRLNLHPLTLPSPRRGEEKGEGGRVIEIYNKDALKAIEDFHKTGKSFDYIFLDPPYYKGMAKNTLIALSSCDILTRNVTLIAEIYKKETLPERIGLFKKVRTSQYGDTKLEFFKRGE